MRCRRSRPSTTTGSAWGTCSKQTRTVLYALGGRRERLLFAAIDSVADSPYNTYTQAGLPPGPIGAPGAAAVDAALNPSDESYLYFVARPDGSHTFTHSLSEHNRATARARREWEISVRP